jgi:cysteine desulfurase
MIYLDAAATTKPDQRVIDTMMPYFTTKWHNPSSLYNKAVDIKKDIDYARSIIGEFISARSDEIFFTSGGSESNCWAVQGFVNECLLNKKKPCIITSKIEHKSILECVCHSSAKSVFIGVDKDGFVNIEELEYWLSLAKDLSYNTLVSIQFANNEIGTIQRIKEIAELVHKYNAIFHTDSVQAFGQLDINVKELGIDMMSMSGHKIGAVKGVGCLYIKNGINIQPLIYGTQMDSMRGGTENVPYIMGMAKAVQLIQRDKECQLRLAILRNDFVKRLRAIGCSMNGSLDERLPNNISVILPDGVTGESVLYMLDMSDIFVSTGAACNSHSVEPSYVLKAIKLTDEEAMRTIRISLPHDITMEDIDYVVDEIEKAIKIIETN